MPVGYTAAIGKGIEFDKFVMQCARERRLQWALENYWKCRIKLQEKN